MLSVTLSLVLALGSEPSTGSDLARARQEVEEQLRQAVQILEPQLDVEFDGLEARQYALKEAAFSLDGVELPVEAGSRQVFRGQVKPGRHALDVHLVYEERKGFGIFTYADAKLTVEGSLGVKAESGLATRLRVRVVADPGADPRHRLKLASELGEQMLAKVDDSVDDLLAARSRPSVAVPAPAPFALAAAPVAAPGSTGALEEPKRHRRYDREVLALQSRPAPAPRTPPAARAQARPASASSAPPVTPTSTPGIAAAAVLPPVVVPREAAPAPIPAPGTLPSSAESPRRLLAVLAMAAGAIVLLGLFVTRLRRA